MLHSALLKLAPWARIQSYGLLRLLKRSTVYLQNFYDISKTSKKNIWELRWPTDHAQNELIYKRVLKTELIGKNIPYFIYKSVWKLFKPNQREKIWIQLPEDSKRKITLRLQSKLLACMPSAKER